MATRKHHGTYMIYFLRKETNGVGFLGRLLNACKTFGVTEQTPGTDMPPALWVALGTQGRGWPFRCPPTECALAHEGAEGVGSTLPPLYQNPMHIKQRTIFSEPRV